MIFWRAEGQVCDRGDHWLVRTPSNPTYYGGNLLFFDRPPGEADYERWVSLFRSAFRDQPEVRHVYFMWDVPGNDPGAVEPFLGGGFELRSDVTLLAGEVHPPPKMNDEIEVRPISTEAEWEALLAAKVRLRGPRFKLDSYTRFKKRWLAGRRRLVDAGQGQWHGAFIRGRMVADLGLFRDGDVARFQDVATDPSFRRRGICGRLVYEVARESLASGQVKTLVMAADENYHAARIYESVGFKPQERHATACRYPPRR
jgi:ribosomal protein S18 acetylase RimI-like enzyme